MIREIISRFLDLLFIPGRNLEVLWLITPLILATIIMTSYFKRYKDEELGWNSAVGNSLIYLFVSISLLRYIYFIQEPVGIINYTLYLSKTIFTLVMLLLGFILLIINFQHLLPKKISYPASSPLTINLIVYIVIMFVYSNINFDWITLIILILFFAIIRFILFLIQKVMESIFSYFDSLKKEEDIESLVNVKKKIENEERELKKTEKIIKGKKLKKVNLEKKHIRKLKKVLKK